MSQLAQKFFTFGRQFANAANSLKYVARLFANLVQSVAIFDLLCCKDVLKLSMIIK